MYKDDERTMILLKITIQIDTREKKNEHIIAVLENSGIMCLHSKLPFGDYMNLDNPRTVIERKNSLCELATCLCKDHERFRNELKNAQSYGIHIIILIEDSDGRNSVEDIKSWVNPFKKKNPHAVSGETLYKILVSMQDKYCFDIEFTSKAASGSRIIQLLGAA